MPDKMDFLIRKKLLLRKYNSNVFSNEQLDFFSKINASEIAVLLKQNPNLRECNVFFEHLPVKQVEKVIASIFEPEQKLIRSEVFNILVNVLRNSTMLLEICFKRNDFNYMSIFGFLEEEHVDYPVLILLEDVLLPFIRKFPFQILEVIINDEFVEEIILRRIYQKPIFKIMYTVIFCLSKRHSETHKDHVKKIINELVQTPFTYLQHKEKFSTQKINLIGRDKTQIKNDIKHDQKPYLQDSSKDLLQIHTKKVKQRRIINGSSQDMKSIESPRIKSIKSKQFMKKSRVQSQSQQSLSPPKRIRQKFSLQINEVDQLTPQQIRSITSIHRYKSIIFNEDLDYSDLTLNMKELLSDIAFNIKSVDLGNLLILLDNINQTYVSGLLQNCQRFLKKDDYEGYCQGAICILMEFPQLYKAALKLLPNNQDLKIGSSSTTNSEPDPLINIVVTKLEKQLNTISSKIKFLCNCIMENNQINGFFSSGQRLKKIGMTKFRMLQLIHLLLQFNSKSNPDNQPHLSINLQINLSHFDLFLIFQKLLISLKWNNLIHGLLVKLTKLLLQLNYQNFKKKYIQNLQKPKDGILGTLMQIFRNKKFVFLKNMQFTNNGNLHAVYEITKSIVQTVKAHEDYLVLINKFPAFDEFVTKDLVAYEKLIEASLLQVHEDPNQTGELFKNEGQKQQNAEKAFNNTIESAEQIIHQIENSKRWVGSSALSLRLVQRKQSI